MGPRGYQGIDGTRGEKGDPGDPGANAYDVARLNGFNGTQIQWLLSLKGAQGDSGFQGNFDDFRVVNSYNTNLTDAELQSSALSAYLGKYLHDRHVDKTAAEYQAMLEAGTLKDTSFYYIYEEDETTVTYTVTITSNNNTYGTASGSGQYSVG